MESKRAKDDRLWIAHFGGSFNPVHAGHIAIGRALLDEHGFDRVVYVPTSGRYPKGDLAPEGDRLALLRLAVANEQRFDTCTRELGQDGWTEPVETIQFLKTQFEQSGRKVRMFSIRGSDWWQEMQTWYEAEEHEGIYEFIVVPRTVVQPEDALSSPKDGTVPPLVRQAHFLPCRASVGVSSSLVRRLVEGSASTVLPVPPGIDAEIRRRGLFRSGSQPH